MTPAERISKALDVIGNAREALAAVAAEITVAGLVGDQSGPVKMAEGMRIISAFRFSDGTRLVFTDHGLVAYDRDMAVALADKDTRLFYVDIASGVVQYLKSEEW